MCSQDLKTTVTGAMLGLITGDALGVPVEFMERDELAQDPVAGMRAYGTHSQPAGTWSDDSSMALCVLESLTYGVDYADMMARLLRWADEGYMAAHDELFDIGIATRRALVRFAHGTPPLECGGSGTYDNGNGSLMRILPVALYLHYISGLEFPKNPEAYQVIHNASALTHAHPISLISCGIYCAVVNELLCGRYTPADIQAGITIAKERYKSMENCAPFLDSFHRVDVGVLQSLPREDIRGSGYVLHTLEAALWCLLHTDSFRSCLLEAINLGEDTDTVGAVAGGLAGIRYGLSEIPPEWLDVIAKRSEIEELCQSFAKTLH